MRPTPKKKCRLVLTWAAAVASAVMVLFPGSTYGRVIDWTSTELIYTPTTSVAYSSCCLREDGQQIQLSDWQADESQRTITISISRPDLEPSETTDPTEPTEATDPTEPTEETNPTEPTETTDPIEPTEGTDPTEPTEGTDPIEPTEGTDPIEPTEGTNTTEPTEETNPTEPTEETNPTDPTEETNPTESIEETEPTDTTEPTEEPEPEVTWPQDEVTVTLDATAAKHLNYTAEVGEDYIQILLERREDALGLERATVLTIDIVWFGLKGTITVNMLPYGNEAVELIDQTEDENQVVTGLIPVQVHDVINREKSIACVKLNLETRADFTLIFMQGSSTLNKVRWSLDGVEYKMLYDTSELTLTWPYQEDWNGVVYLDFSSALESDVRPTIVVEASEYPTQDFTPVQVAIPEVSEQILKASNLPHTILINPKWGAAKLQVVQIEKLTADAEGNLVYMQDTALYASVTDDGIMLTPTTADIYPEPGSYRLITQWIWNEIAVEEQMIYFFVNTN